MEEKEFCTECKSQNISIEDCENREGSGSIHGEEVRKAHGVEVRMLVDCKICDGWGEFICCTKCGSKKLSMPVSHGVAENKQLALF
jgi:DnaJ-class molecular chaperone